MVETSPLDFSGIHFLQEHAALVAGLIGKPDAMLINSG